MNKLFLHYIKKYTFHPYELIIIDNASKDGSANFFKDNGAKVIENQANYSYPYSQNQGIRIAKYNWYAFLNNDIIVAPAWDRLLIESANKHNLDIVSPCGIEQLETKEITKKIRRRWNWIKNPLLFFFGSPLWNLKLMHRLMYSDWEEFCRQRASEHGSQIMEGMIGHSIIMNKIALDKVGFWDERIQSADWDLVKRTNHRKMTNNDISSVHICLDVFHHHFGRLTYKSKHTPFADASNHISLNEKWHKKFNNIETIVE
jgi:GT2 family glycosyltransferase